MYQAFPWAWNGMKNKTLPVWQILRLSQLGCLFSKTQSIFTQCLHFNSSTKTGDICHCLLLRGASEQRQKLEEKY